MRVTTVARSGCRRVSVSTLAAARGRKVKRKAMKITVLTASSSVELEVKQSDQVSELKAQLSQQLPSAERAHLVYGGHVLSDEESTLDELGIVDGATVLATLSRVRHPTREMMLDGFSLEQARRISPRSNSSQLDKPHADDLKLVHSFVDSLSAEAASWTWRPSATEHRALKAAVAALTTGSTPAFDKAPCVTWFGEYGCALIARTPRVEEMHLELLGLDGWTFRGERTVSSQAELNSPVSLHVGTIPLDKYHDFLRLTSKFLDAAKERKGGKRTAAANDQGHQKTPAMIHAVMIDAIEALYLEQEPEEGTTAPRGGFTDVGLHTGGAARDTAWALVRSVLQVVIEAAADHDLYRVMLSQLHLCLAESCLNLAIVDTSAGSQCPCRFQNRLNVGMELLQHAVTEGATLADEGVSMAVFEARCVVVRFELNHLVAEHMRQRATDFFLPPIQWHAVKTSKNPALALPAISGPATNQDGLTATRKLAETNLEWLTTLTTFGSMGTSLWMLAWLARIQPASSSDAALLAMHQVEIFFFEHACKDLQPGGGQPVIGSSSFMQDLIDQYREVVASFTRSAASAALLSPELLSRELLVVWIAACLCHKTTKTKDPLLKDYAIPLDPDDLRYLVLSERTAIDAARNVAAYLRANRPSGCSSVFSLRANDHTFELSRRHSEGSSSIRHVWDVEQQAAAKRQQDHWQEVLWKQEKLRLLDRELSELEAHHRDQQAIFDSTRPISHRTSTEQNQRRNRAQAQLASLSQQIQWKNSEIKSTAVPPPGILQPLAASRDKAMAVLFWYHMPADYQVLSRLCFTAQQMLLPKASQVTVSDDEQVNIGAKIASAAPATGLRDYYLSQSTTRSFSAVDTKVLLGSHGRVVSGNWYPSNVRQFTNANDGIWHPDSLLPIMSWTGGSCSLDSRGGHFDPFRLMPPAVLVHKFTVTLGSGAEQLQWAAEQHGSESKPERGNKPEAVQDIKLHWLSRKPEHLAFGALRAYPKQQIRKMLSALHDRNLPLDQPAVRLLLLQTLFHLGELSPDAALKPVWRTDLVEHDGWDALGIELSGASSEIEHAHASAIRPP